MHLGQIAAQTPDKPAVVMAGSGGSSPTGNSTTSPTGSRSCSAAAGLRPGDHIAFCLENHPRFLEIAWAAQRSGLYYTAISSRLTADELAYIVDDCGAQVFITSRLRRPTWRPSSPDACRCRGPADARRHGRRLRALRGRRRRATRPTPLDDECEGVDMLYSLGHDRAAPRASSRRCPSARSGTPDRVTSSSSCCSARRRHGLPVARAALPRRAAALRHRRTSARRHRRRDGALRPRAGAGR